MSKKMLMCSKLTGKIYYTSVKEIEPGVFVNTSQNKIEIDEMNFLDCMITKLSTENNKIEIKDNTGKKYIIKLEVTENETKD